MELQIGWRRETVKMNMLQQDTGCKLRSPQRRSSIPLDSYHMTSKSQTKRRFQQDKCAKKAEQTVAKKEKMES